MTHSSTLQPLLQSLESPLSIELVPRVEEGVVDPLARTLRTIDSARHVEGFADAGFGEDVVVRAALAEEEARGDQAGEVGHLEPAQDAGDVVVDAVGAAVDRIAERAEGAREHGDLHA